MQKERDLLFMLFMSYEQHNSYSVSYDELFLKTKKTGYDFKKMVLRYVWVRYNGKIWIYNLEGFTIQIFF